jgi:hypothetical protein
MTLKRSRKHLGSFNPEADAIILDRGESCLRDAGALGELILAKALQLANDAHGLPDRNPESTLGRAKISHYDLR